LNERPLNPNVWIKVDYAPFLIFLKKQCKETWLQCCRKLSHIVLKGRLRVIGQLKLAPINQPNRSSYRHIIRQTVDYQQIEPATGLVADKRLGQYCRLSQIIARDDRAGGQSLLPRRDTLTRNRQVGLRRSHHRVTK